MRVYIVKHPIWPNDRFTTSIITVACACKTLHYLTLLSAITATMYLENTRKTGLLKIGRRCAIFLKKFDPTE